MKSKTLLKFINALVLIATIAMNALSNSMPFNN